MASESFFESSGGSRTWIPRVDESLKPKIGSIFPSVEHAFLMYKAYAKEAGFVVRRSSQKMNPMNNIQNKYFVCSKYGEPEKKSYDSLNPAPGQKEMRNSNVKRTGCSAYVKFRLVKRTTSYECYGFVEEHNHPLLREHEKPFSRPARQMTFADEMIVHDAGTSKMGASRAHKLRTSMIGGYEHGGPSVVDYQNYKRDCDKFVGRGDAKMLVEQFRKRKLSEPNFFYAYKCEKDELKVIFWADEVALFNYSEFGDVISFDATFRTNR